MTEDASAALSARLAAACSRHLGAGGAVESLRRLTGGASQQTWSFDFRTEDGSRFEWMLRCDPRESTQMANLASATEFELLRVARAGGVPVPQPHFLLAEGDGFGRGYVMERVAGETIPRKILRDAEYDDVWSVRFGLCRDADRKREKEDRYEVSHSDRLSHRTCAMHGRLARNAVFAIMGEPVHS